MNTAYKLYLDDMLDAYIAEESLDDTTLGTIDGFLCWVATYEQTHAFIDQPLKEPSTFQFAEANDDYITESIDPEYLRNELDITLLDALPEETLRTFPHADAPEYQENMRRLQDSFFAFAGSLFGTDATTFLNCLMSAWQKERWKGLDASSSYAMEDLDPTIEHLCFGFESLLQLVDAFGDHLAQQANFQPEPNSHHKRQASSR